MKRASFIPWLCCLLAGPMAATEDPRQFGTQYSPLQQINTSNVSQLELAWEYHTGDVAPEELKGLMAFEDHPTLVEGNLIVCTTNRKIIALDPKNGKERWRYDPNPGVEPITQKCRGVSTWVDSEAEEGSQCKTRLVIGTPDYRLVAIDAVNGELCAGFGKNGVVTMDPGKPLLSPDEVNASSNPAVVNDVIVVGSAVTDLQRVDAPSGRVQAFDARSGVYLWQFDPVPRDPSDPAMATWPEGTENIGQGNVWSSMAVDPQRDLVFLPTTSVSDDYFGGERPGDNLYGSSVVALRGATGEVVWYQQLVHHDVWDYDVPARPVLIDYPVAGEMVPALVQNTKMGIVFVFNRETGEPLVPLEERPVPQQGIVPGEVLSPTQPFPVGMPTVTPHDFSKDSAWGFTPLDKWWCKNEIESYDHGPIYTPITERGTIVNPPIGGGANWGGSAYDPKSHIMVVPTNRVPLVVKLVPRAKAGKVEGLQVESSGAMKYVNTGSRYVVEAAPLLSPLGAPCSQPPWAALTAVDIVNKKIVWEKPLGSIKNLAPIPLDWELGTPGAGGPLATAGGVTFIGFSSDNRVRALNTATGELLWQADLPAPGTAIPISYEIDGVQYVVIAAGGHSMFTKEMGDSVVAFKLK